MAGRRAAGRRWPRGGSWKSKRGLRNHIANHHLANSHAWKNERQEMSAAERRTGGLTLRFWECKKIRREP